MKIIQKCKKMLLMVIMCLVLSAGTVPAMNAYAETVQTETVQTDGAEWRTDGRNYRCGQRGRGDFLLSDDGRRAADHYFAVVAAMSTVSSSIAVAANMDVDGE